MMILVIVLMVKMLINLCAPPSLHQEKWCKSLPLKRISKLNQKKMRTLQVELLKIQKKRKRLQQKRRHLLSLKRSPRKEVRTESQRKLLQLQRGKQSQQRGMPSLVVKLNLIRAKMTVNL